MHGEEPTPKKTIEILDKLLSRGLTEPEFRDMHHLGDSTSGFRKYCETIKSFRPNGNNQKLAAKLYQMLKP